MNIHAAIPPSAPPLIALDRLSKAYTRGSDEIRIFDDMSLSFSAGEFVAIMGPSGAGKTTLLNILAGIDRTASGEYFFAGEAVGGLGEAAFSRWRARHVGLIFQSYNLLPTLDAEQNVELPLLLSTMDRRERRLRVALALDVVGLADRARHRPAELSGGQQQRVAIARAIVADPELILADEPTGDLDRASSDDVLRMLALLSSGLGKTVIMVTHDHRAADVAQRTLHLDKGRFVTRERLK